MSGQGNALVRRYAYDVLSPARATQVLNRARRLDQRTLVSPLQGFDRLLGLHPQGVALGWLV